MRNKILLWIIPLVAVILVIHVNYTFADNDDRLDPDIGNIGEKHDNVKNDDCDGKFECNIPSLKQLHNQDNQCEGNAKCTNESFSNIVLCKDSSLCLFQYEGPFEMLNPY